ncbi:YolD-like family protein [Paenibacillus pini]|nr:YolD-like family protein [Paenibacillus pini]
MFILHLCIPEHREAYVKQMQNKDSRVKPIIDEQQWQLVEEALGSSFRERVRVTLIIFDPFEDKQLSGVVTTVNTHLKEIKLSYDDDFSWIKFSDILSAYT